MFQLVHLLCIERCIYIFFFDNYDIFQAILQLNSISRCQKLDEIRMKRCCSCMLKQVHLMPKLSKVKTFHTLYSINKGFFPRIFNKELELKKCRQSRSILDKIYREGSARYREKSFFEIW